MHLITEWINFILSSVIFKMECFQQNFGLCFKGNFGVIEQMCFAGPMKCHLNLAVLN